MANTWHVNRDIGTPGGAGTEVDPRDTILNVLGLLSAGDKVIVHKSASAYLEGDYTFTSAAFQGCLFQAAEDESGDVLVDWQGQDGTQADNSHWNWEGAATGMTFDGIQFKNPGAASGGLVFRSSYASAADIPRFINCAFYNVTGPANYGWFFAASTNNRGFYLENCGFDNLELGIHNPGGGTPGFVFYNCYFTNMAVANVMTNETGAGTHDFNAYEGNTESNGIDTVSSPGPGHEDPSNDRMYLDEAGTDWDVFGTAGRFGKMIGRPRGGLRWSPYYPQTRYFTRDPSDGNVFVNEGPNGTGDYTEGTPTDVIENGNFELESDIGTVPTATGARVRSPVRFFPDGARFIRASYGSSQDATGKIDTDDTLPADIYRHRSSNSAFLADDLSPSWVEYAKGDLVDITANYHQWDFEMQDQHTNA